MYSVVKCLEIFYQSTSYSKLFSLHWNDVILLLDGGHIDGQHDILARFAVIRLDSGQFVFHARQWDNKTSSYICQLQKGMFKYRTIFQFNFTRFHALVLLHESRCSRFAIVTVKVTVFDRERWLHFAAGHSFWPWCHWIVYLLTLKTLHTLRVTWTTPIFNVPSRVRLNIRSLLFSNDGLILTT